MDNLLYTDFCNEELTKKIKSELKLNIVLTLDEETWSLSEALGLVMVPNIKIAVFNKITEITVIEMGLLHFMCKPILITAKNIKDYPITHKRIIDYVEPECDLRVSNSKFIEWYKSWER
jgi:hypothetical protein